MARVKKYNEEEVIEKALNLFWVNGYESTSTRMLEKAMGINQFSIYSSFKNKQGVLVESINAYKRRLDPLLNNLKDSPKGLQAIKEYFYEFIEFSKENEQGKGCFIANISNELGLNGDEIIMTRVATFTKNVRQIFAEKLNIENKYTDDELKRKSNFLIMSMTSVATLSRVYPKHYIHDYIETLFEKL